MVAGGRLKGADTIGVRVGKVPTNTRSPSTSSSTSRTRRSPSRSTRERVAAEAALDGLYVIRTSVTDMTRRAGGAQLQAAGRGRAGLPHAQRHRSSGAPDPPPSGGPRASAHILLSMLAYYVQWHMIEAWAPLTFADEAGDDAARLPIPLLRPGARRRRSPRCTRARWRMARRR